jgi:hypothetical protein
MHIAVYGIGRTDGTGPKADARICEDHITALRTNTANHGPCRRECYRE